MITSRAEVDVLLSDGNLRQEMATLARSETFKRMIEIADFLGRPVMVNGGCELNGLANAKAAGVREALEILQTMWDIRPNAEVPVTYGAPPENEQQPHPQQ